MSTKSRPDRNLQNPTVLPQTTALIAIASFALGAGVTWYAMHDSSGNSQQPPSYIAAAPKGAVPAGNPASSQTIPEAPSSVPPDVSQLPPAQAALALGNWHYDRKNWSTASTQYQKAISLGLDNADIRTDLGNSLRFEGEAQKALEQYQIAQLKNAQHENSLINMATLYSEVLQDRVKAMSTIQEYLRRFPNGERVQAAQQFLRELNSSAGLSPHPGSKASPSAP